MDREHQLTVWAADQLQSAGYVTGDDFSLIPASNDASFRRYFRCAEPLSRVPMGDRNFVFMDAPPEFEDSAPFVAIDGMLLAAGVRVPKIHAVDLARGFMMLTDFGGDLLLDALRVAQRDERLSLYAMAMRSLTAVQTTPSAALPAYDAMKLREEMGLFRSWFIERLLGYAMSIEETMMLERVCETLVESALEQPAVFVHRDYHARNLMLVPAEPGDLSLGVLDFQDAVSGPVTYDLVSLLRDCYFRLPDDELDQLVSDAHQALVSANSELSDASLPLFLQWFDLMGLQRHLKCAGIFSRLCLRDGKAGYIADIPLVLRYLVDASASVDAFSAFNSWLRSEIIPTFDAYLANVDDDPSNGSSP